MKQFHFRDDEIGEQLTLNIPEVLDPSYGMYVWPCAPVLAQYVWHNRNLLHGKHVLELGAGTALPGVVAAKVGAKVTLSDASHLADCLENCRASLRENDITDAAVAAISWGQFDADLLTLDTVDIILGSDCFYDTKDFEDIIMTVSYLLHKNPQAEFWTTYQDRSSDRCVINLLNKWKLKSEVMPLSEFGGDKTTENNCDIQTSDSQPVHTITMYKLTNLN